ncbi:MAG: EI24 domain-containing protein [Planctomycetota bacterium]|jgi:uncharacterized protein involved in cysteine biosynthesis
MSAPTEVSPSQAPDATRCWRCGSLPEAARVERPASGEDIACHRCDADLRLSSLGKDAHAVNPVQFLQGVEGALRGAVFLGEHPRLWAWIVTPLLINTLLFSGFIVLALQGGQALMPDLATGDWGWFDWLRTALGPTLQVLLTIVAVLASLLVTLMVAGVVNAPFYDLLSEAVENIALDRKDPGRPWSAFFGDSLFAMAAALSLVWRQAFVLAVLWLFSFTAVGVPVFIAAGFYYTGFALIDVTLARKRYPAKSRRAWARRHAIALLGLGLPVAIIPPLQPFGIVGATLLYLASHDKR